MSITLYVEGGGQGKDLRTACRKGFSKFIEKAGLTGSMPRIVACGPRGDAYSKFQIAHTQKSGDAILLVDSEGSVTASGSWQHLKNRDGWDRPPGASDGQCHLMVQVMESWFLADRDALASFYGQGFRAQALPDNQEIEKVLKPDVLDRLDRATGDTTKGNYNKGKHSFEILAMLDPEKVRNASPHADRFLGALSA